MTPASLLTEIMDRADRLQREEAVGRAFASLSQDDDYWAEMRVWDVIASEALPEG